MFAIVIDKRVHTAYPQSTRAFSHVYIHTCNFIQFISTQVFTYSCNSADPYVQPTGKAPGISPVLVNKWVALIC